MQSLPWVVLVFGIVHFAAQLEFAALAEGATRLHRWAHALLTTAAWLAIALALAGHLPWQLIPVALTVIMLVYSFLALRRYERGQDQRMYIVLLRSLLFITLPMAFIPALITWPGAIPFYLLLIGASWGSDTGAIFTGKYLGRTPLCPRLSPKKTVEGAVGGMITAGAIWAGAVAVYPSAAFGVSPDSVNWLLLILFFFAGAAISVIGMFGDLLFSLYKRVEGIKDYGELIPGHGGILDRFDSMIFVAPVLYMVCVALR
jgi:phosphatidate cytidylyltransferase